ncbi:metallophosphoesterase [Colwellia sp. 20A7]|uniref:metallophosphoesterase n=1 Tax=Colwellia sp. 20A7 TaxID=2689569 RepID=UPI0013589B8D|nr:metallophosphoesterase [Colwellia sp. 20A7]
MNRPAETFVIAQFSDCHLFADKQAKHLGANVWQNLNRVLTDIAQRKNVDGIVFTGDLTQDHTEDSYHHFVHAIEQAKFAIPVYFLAGNHDDRALLSQHLVEPNFQPNKMLYNDFWQIQLLDSKSDTPSGLVSSQNLQALSQQMDSTKFQLLMMHHHPIDVGYYIDKHGLLAQDDFWKTIAELNEKDGQIKGIACGHVHRAVHLSKFNVDVYTCPATSVQFGDTKEEIGSILPSYQLLYLESNGTMSREIIVF